MATRIVRIRQGSAVPLPASCEAVFHLRQLPAFLHQLRLCFGSFVPHLSFLLIQILQDLYPARTTREKKGKVEWLSEKSKNFFRRLNPYKNVRVEAGLYKPRFAAGGKKRKKKRRGHAAPGTIQLEFFQQKLSIREISFHRNLFLHRVAGRYVSITVICFLPLENTKDRIYRMPESVRISGYRPWLSRIKNNRGGTKNPVPILRQHETDPTQAPLESAPQWCACVPMAR